MDIFGDYIEEQFEEERPKAYDRIATLNEEAKDEALKHMFKQQWIQYYKICPPLIMKINEEKINQAKIERARSIILLTINSKPGTDIDDFCNWAAIRVCTKSWIGKIHETAVERGSETQNLHCHIVFSLAAQYTPSEIIRFIWRTSGCKDFIDSKNFINVVKMANRDIGNAINYCRKNASDPDCGRINKLIKSGEIAKLRSKTFV